MIYIFVHPEVISVLKRKMAVGCKRMKEIISCAGIFGYYMSPPPPTP